MARFTLVVRPDGRALLVTNEAFAAESLEPVREALDAWVAGVYQVGVLADTDVVRIEELEVDFELRRVRRVAATA